jgi:hypothetical protein
MNLDVFKGSFREMRHRGRVKLEASQPAISIPRKLTSHRMLAHKPTHSQNGADRSLLVASDIIRTVGEGAITFFKKSTSIS